MSANNFNIKGLDNNKVLSTREKYDWNQLNYKKENELFDV